MTIDHQVRGLISKYHNLDLVTSIPLDTFKELSTKLNQYPLSFVKIYKTVLDKGYIVVTEPLLVYNKQEQHAYLTVNPKKDDQIITKLNFEPSTYQEVLTRCKSNKFFTSGLVLKIEHKSYTSYNNILIIANSFELLKDVKYKYQDLI